MKIESSSEAIHFDAHLENKHAQKYELSVN